MFDSEHSNLGSLSLFKNLNSNLLIIGVVRKIYLGSFGDNFYSSYRACSVKLSSRTFCLFRVWNVGGVETILNFQLLCLGFCLL